MTRYLLATAAADQPSTLDWHTVEAESRWLAEAVAKMIAGVGGSVWCVANAGEVMRSTAVPPSRT